MNLPDPRSKKLYYETVVIITRLLKILLTIIVCFFALPAKNQISRAITPVLTSDPSDFGGRVNCLFQDKTGFIWIGKETGLFRYDGYQLKTFHYNNSDTSSIGNDNIQCIAEDAKGTLWIGTKGGGLNRYNRKFSNFTRYNHNESNPASIAYNEVFTLLPDSIGNLWIGTDGGGLDYFDINKGRFIHFKQDDSGLISNKILAILPDKKGNLWLGTWDGGLHFMDIKTKKIIHIGRNNKEVFGNRKAGTINIFKIAEQKPGTLLLATWGQGLVSYNTINETFKERISKSIANFRDVKIDESNNAWVASSSGLFFLPFKSDHYSPVTDNSGLFDNASALLFDRTSTLWLGSEDGSVGKINSFKKKFNSFPETELSGNVITSIATDYKTEELLAGFKNKLAVINSTTLNSEILTGPYTDLVSAIFLGDQILTASSDGLALLNSKKKKFTKINLDSSLSGRQIWTIYPDSDSSFWVGALGVAYYLVKQGIGLKIARILPTGQKNGLTHSHYPACFLKDKNGNLWIGTFGGGLNMLSKDQKFVYFEHHENNTSSISDNFVECLLEDSKGNIWIGTHNGLDCYNATANTIKHYNLSAGLQNNWIASIEEDLHGNIWVSTHDGISCIKKNGTTFNYDTDDGLPSNYFLPRASSKLRNGQLWFGSNRGLVLFHPDSIQVNPFLPEIVITDFSINNQSIQPGNLSPLATNIELCNSITLNKEQSSFSFQFVALNYFNAKKNKYKYILKGYDKQWHLAGTNRKAEYSNVPPGKYIFSVIAANNDGIWSSKEKSISVIITGLSSKKLIAAIILLPIIVVVILLILRKYRKKKLLIIEETEPGIKKLSPPTYLEVNPSEIITDSPEQAFLQKLLKAVEENLSDSEFGVDELCYKICISRSQLYRKIHAITGLSVTEFIKEVRLKRAAQFLKQKPDNISEIAYNVGFNDPKYFSKCFKQKFGMSPARYITDHEQLLPPE